MGRWLSRFSDNGVEFTPSIPQLALNGHLKETNAAGGEHDIEPQWFPGDGCGDLNPHAILVKGKVRRLVMVWQQLTTEIQRVFGFGAGEGLAQNCTRKPHHGRKNKVEGGVVIKVEPGRLCCVVL